jgi:glucose-6-phosphate isomerase
MTLMQTTTPFLTPSLATVDFDAATGLLHGAPVVEDVRSLGELKGVFEDEAAWSRLDPAIPAYRVRCYFPVPDGTAGGLFFGCTFLEPGTVGGEYFKTKGHFHAKRDTGEFYWGIRGEGILLLMNEDRTIRAERVTPGSLHYVPGRVAHRVVNVGDETLSFGACWPSDAGHDYETIRENGFSARVFRGPHGPEIRGCA